MNPNFALIDRNSRGRSGWLPRLTTIRARLYIAFGFAAAMTLVCSLIALYSFTKFGETTTRMVERSMPATVESLRLAEETSGLVASAPRLMAVENARARTIVVDEITNQTRSLVQRIERLKALDDSGSQEIHVAQIALVERLDTLNRYVSDRIAISEHRRAMALSVRKVHEEFLEGITPAIDDANYELMTTSQDGEYTATLRETLESLRRLLEVQAEANLLAGLLTEASLVTESARLQPLSELIEAAKRKIDTNLKALADPAQQKKLIALYDRLASTGDQNGIIVLRARELNAQREAQLAFAATQSEAAKLKHAVDKLVERQRSDAQFVSLQAAEQVRSGKILLVAISFIALGGAALIAWLYVGRNIARRLGLLSAAMRRIADGALNVTIPDEGRDEISDMARTLRVFRKATEDVAAARQDDDCRARTAETRRQEIEVATRTFEQAVSEVIGALERASQAMTNSARAVSESAGRNQEESLATAAASEQATQNVKNVAGAAEEIARSIDNISAQIGESATIASQAAGEAQSITAAVEGLASSVAEIGEVSNLIRSIAGQTNLLALNATIEAARAGEAGRGFAIVAQEVKSLAAQTGQATEHITQRIASIEETSSRAVEAMKTIVGTIKRLDEIANEVAGAAEQQGAVTQEIARNAGAAAQGTQEVSASISQVSKIAANTEQVASAVLSAANELAARSNMLKDEVGHFLAQVRAA